MNVHCEMQSPSGGEVGGAAGPWGADSTVSPQQNVFVSGVCGTVFVDLILYVWSLD